MGQVMPDPTPQDHERAHAYAWRDGLCIAATKSAPHGMACGVIATALADQRERDAQMVDNHTCGNPADCRMCKLAAAIRSGESN